MKRVLAIVFSLFIIVGRDFISMITFSDKRFSNDTIQYCSVSTGGGMLGGSDGVRLSREKDGSVTLRVTSRETHADREITTVYQAKEENLDYVRGLVRKYRLYTASTRPYSEMRALDAATTTVSFSFEKDSFSISEEQILSSKMREGFRTVIRYLNSLAVGEGVTTKEAQKALLYLRSGYTLQFIVEDEFDGRLDGILSEEREVSRFRENGIVLAEGEAPDLSNAEAIHSAEAGSIVFVPGSKQIILLYTDLSFKQPVYLLARMDHDPSSAAPLISEMEGPYCLYLN